MTIKSFKHQMMALIGLGAKSLRLALRFIGFVVDDLDGVAERLRSSGYREGMSAMDHPHRRRIYFFDDDDNEYEFVEYLSTDPSDRNDYQM